MDLLGGALLGAATGESLTAVLDFSERAINFDNNLQGFESRANEIFQIVREIQELDGQLNPPNEETKKFTVRMEEAQKLILKCSKTPSWNWVKKASNSKKLKEYEDSQVRFYQTHGQVLLIRYVKKIVAKFDESREGRPVCGPNVYAGSSGAPEVPSCSVGVNEIDPNLNRMWSSVSKYLADCDQNVLVDSCVAPEVPASTVHLHNLKMMLLDDVLRVVLLSSPGGYGKTTLAQMLCLDVDIKGIFRENIFFIAVSMTPNLRVIVQDMFRCKGFLVPEFQNDEDAINQLENLLKQIGPDPILVVLDDVWPGSKPLIQKFMFPIPGYKILVTSRSEFPGLGSTYKLEILSEQDAMSLFCQSAFPQGGSMNVPESLLHEIVRECNRLPLALEVVGGSLRGQPEVIWRHTLMQLSERESIFDSNHDLLICLQTSIETLNEKTHVKDCFLDLASFPEDQRIPVTALMDMWAELYNLDEDGIYALTNLHKLAFQNLVFLEFTRKEASEIAGYYNEHFVTLHDLLRELAIYLSSQEPIEQRKRLIMDI
ncbi:probable disease resistance protein At5g66910 [Cornus florida]|uniref:probable disease resistance protein At5g66910 n=1 Tax=Cornus florida TaxID=4283 RepID=UPI0028985905|nr:probable disease resistance protein At5g66910 [Cornus florida]